MVDVDKVIERFREGTRTILTERSRNSYIKVFREFDQKTGLERYSRRQLGGTKGKKLIQEYIAGKAKPSWRFLLAALKSVWVHGLGLPWPIDTKRDFGRLPRTKRGESPSDSIVREWAEALGHEKDLLNRLVWLLIAQHGWRPSHLAHIKWRNVRYDEQDRPVAIVAYGGREGFKTEAPIAVRLTPEVQEVLANWHRAHYGGPEALIVPFRNQKGDLDFTEVPSDRFGYRLLDLWKRLRAKWDLPPLRMKDLRHWVATTCRKAGLSKQATAYMMGHDPAQGGAMRDWYDNPQMEDVFAEQAEILPDGPLGYLLPKVEITEGLPPEAVDLLRAYLAGEVGTMEFATRMESVRARMPRPRSPDPLEP